MRDHVVDEIVEEAPGVRSFFLRPAAGQALAPARAGQYVAVRTRLPGVDGVSRPYSLSAVGPDRYRLTVKREAPRPGRGVSAALHDHGRVGDAYAVSEPLGGFCCDLADGRPRLLVAGGVGVTPFLPMLAEAATHPRAEALLLYAASDPQRLAFVRELAGAARAAGGRVRVQAFLSRSEPPAGLGLDARRGRLGPADLVAAVDELGPDAEALVCGPAGLMAMATEALLDAGLTPDQVRTESFEGAVASAPAPPAAVPGAAGPPPSEPKPAPAAAAGVSVRFERSGVSASWAPGGGTLLELAEREGVALATGCLFGDCGTCMTPLVSGEVEHDPEPGYLRDPGTCLPCCARPLGPVVLDA